MSRIETVFIGYGNSARWFLEFLEMARRGGERGLLVWHEKVGGYRPHDIEVRGFFDIDCRKVSEKNTPPVYRGVLLDEARFLREAIGDVCTDTIEGFRRQVRALDPEIAVLAINSGEEKTSREYARILRESGVSLVNMTPEAIARDSIVRGSFVSEGLLVVGDDLMSHVGGTILHKYLVRLFTRRGLRVIKSYQLDVSGTLETYVTTDESIRALKRDLKSSTIEIEGAGRVVAGTTDYVPFLEDQRVSHIYIEIEAPMSKVFRIEVKYWSYDGVNAINTLLDVIRAVKASLDENSGDKTLIERDIEIISAYGFKAPPRPVDIERALTEFEERFVRDKRS